MTLIKGTNRSIGFTALCRYGTLTIYDLFDDNKDSLAEANQEISFG